MELFFVCAGIFGLVGTAVFLFNGPSAIADEGRVKARLSALGTGEIELKQEGLVDDGSGSLWRKVTELFLGETGLKAQYGRMRRLLHQAGYPGAKGVYVFIGVRLCMVLILGVATFLATASLEIVVHKMVLLLGGAMALGYYGPLVPVKSWAQSRKRSIQETLPDAMDLLVVCVEAGLGLDAALAHVADEQASQGLIIGDELKLAIQEMQAGISRREALSRMADRLEIDDLGSLVTFIIQTEDLGGSIANSLRVHAATMRQKRSQRAEEAARKAVVKLVFPVVLFILPALFLVVLGPPIVNMMRVLSTVGFK